MGLRSAQNRFLKAGANSLQMRTMDQMKVIPGSRLKASIHFLILHFIIVFCKNTNIKPLKTEENQVFPSFYWVTWYDTVNLDILSKIFWMIHINLLIEFSGIVHQTKPFFSVQFHPEHTAGPEDLGTY